MFSLSSYSTLLARVAKYKEREHKTSQFDVWKA